MFQKLEVEKQLGISEHTKIQDADAAHVQKMCVLYFKSANNVNVGTFRG